MLGDIPLPDEDHAGWLTKVRGTKWGHNSLVIIRAARSTGGARNRRGWGHFSDPLLIRELTLDRALFETAYVCGARASETCALEVVDFDLRLNEDVRIHG